MSGYFPPGVSYAPPTHGISHSPPTNNLIQNQSTDGVESEPGSSRTRLWSSSARETSLDEESPAFQSLTAQTDNSGFRKTIGWKFRNATSRFWIGESLACILSLLLIVLICVKMRSVQGMPTYEWDWPWGLNSILAFATTILKGATMIPVAAGLGQLKWHWFRKFKSVRDMELFDDASRGMLGSIRLLAALRFWHIASLGAFITVANLFIDTLIQNAVQVHLRPVNKTDSYVFRTNIHQATSKFYFGEKNELPPYKMVATINYGMLAPGEDLSLSENRLFDCVSGNCTFPFYQSLVLEYECINSTVAPVGSSPPRFIHPSAPAASFWLDKKTGLINSTVLPDYPEKNRLTLFEDPGPLVARWLVLASPNTLNDSAVATECLFYWAVNTYSANVHMNVWNETATDTWTNTTDRDITDHSIILKPPTCWIRGEQVKNASNTACWNVVAERAHRSLRNFFSRPDVGLVGEAFNATNSSDTVLKWGYSSMFMQTLLAPVVNRPFGDVVYDLDQTAINIAYSTTNSLRVQPYFDSKEGEDQHFNIMNGTTIWPDDPFYHVYWGYMLLPIALVGLSILFFLTTVFVSRKEPTWKTSILAALFHGLSTRDTLDMGDVSIYADMRGCAKKMQVELVDTGLGKKLASKKALRKGLY